MKNKFLPDGLFLLVGSLLTLSGCKTSGDIAHERMNHDPAEVRTVPRYDEQPRAANNNGANAGVNEEQAREIEVLKGQIQEQAYLRDQQKTQFEARIAQLESEKKNYMDEIQALKGSGTAETAKGGDLIWETAQKDIQSKNYSKAANTLKEFLENFPKDQRASEAIILKGQSEYASEQFKTALVTFGSYLDRYPKGKDGAMAWLGQATSLIRMKQKKDAKLFLEQCVSLYPKSREAKVAKKLLKTPNLVPALLYKI